MNPRAALAAVITGGTLTALVHGAVDGPRWMLILGLNLTILILVVVDLINRVQVPGVAADLRSGGPRAFAPAVVHGVRAVHRKSGRSALDPTSPETAFEFDITVVPEERAAFRVKVRHPLDLQDARTRRSMVVEYDPTQPWQVVVPVRAPQEWADRARSLNPSEPEADEIVPRRPGSVDLGLGSLIAAALLGLIQLAG